MYGHTCGTCVDASCESWPSLKSACQHLHYCPCHWCCVVCPQELRLLFYSKGEDRRGGRMKERWVRGEQYWRWQRTERKIQTHGRQAAKRQSEAEIVIGNLPNACGKFLSVLCQKILNDKKIVNGCVIQTWINTDTVIKHLGLSVHYILSWI